MIQGSSFGGCRGLVRGAVGVVQGLVLRRCEWML